VNNQKEAKLVPVLLSKVKEYITGLRIELERKRLV
jgi:hypothetical protein